MRKKKAPQVIYTHGFATEGQRVTGDGEWVIMKDGSRFKRTVLKSSAVKAKPLVEDSNLVDLLEIEKDQLSESD